MIKNRCKRNPSRKGRGRKAGDGGKEGLTTKVYRLGGKRWRWSLVDFFGVSVAQGSYYGSRVEAKVVANSRKVDFLNGSTD